MIVTCDLLSPGLNLKLIAHKSSLRMASRWRITFLHGSPSAASDSEGRINHITLVLVNMVKGGGRLSDFAGVAWHLALGQDIENLQFFATPLQVMHWFYPVNSSLNSLC